jgi:hypothetical protein
MGVGGSADNRADVVWILKKGGAPDWMKFDRGKNSIITDERLTLACYQVQNNGRSIRLVAIRDLSYDMQLIELGNDKPHVTDIIEDLKKQKEKIDKAKQDNK